MPDSDRVKELSYEDFFNEVRSAIAIKQPNWEVQNTAHITLFPDAKAQKRSLYSIMQRPLPPIDAATEAELASLEKLFQQKAQ